MLIAVLCSLSGNTFDQYELPLLKTKFVRCSIRTCVRHVEQLLRLKLDIPAHLAVQVICGDRILDEWITLKQVWLSCWFTKVAVACPSPPLDNIWVMVIVWSLRGNIVRIALCWIVWHNVYSQQHTYISSSYRSSRLGLSHWDHNAVRRGGCLELYYCNMVEWFWKDSSLIFDDQLVSFSALTLLVWSSGLQKSSPKWRIVCWVGR